MAVAATANYMTNAGILAIGTSVSVPAFTTTLALATTQDAPNFSQVSIASIGGTIIGVALGICILRSHYRILTNKTRS
ncbi:MAG TPA: hypothetical protein V6D15_09435 [Oculatellaceae cyanobacterium]